MKLYTELLTRHSEFSVPACSIWFSSALSLFIYRFNFLISFSSPFVFLELSQELFLIPFQSSIPVFLAFLDIFMVIHWILCLNFICLTLIVSHDYDIANFWGWYFVLAFMLFISFLVRSFQHSHVDWVFGFHFGVTPRWWVLVKLSAVWSSVMKMFRDGLYSNGTNLDMSRWIFCRQCYVRKHITSSSILWRWMVESLSLGAMLRMYFGVTWVITLYHYLYVLLVLSLDYSHFCAPASESILSLVFELGETSVCSFF